MRRRALAIIIVALGSMALLEGAVRVYSHLAYPKMMVLDATLGWRHAPNRSKTFQNELGEEIRIAQNRYGFRGPEFSLDAPEKAVRILVLGDSFVEGNEVTDDDLFTTNLDVGSDSLEVLNAGVGGWGTVQEYVFLEQEGLSFDPDLVLVMVYENDYADNCLSHSPGFGPRPHATRGADGIQLVRNPDPAPFRRYILPLPFSTWFNRHSYVFNVANNRVYQPLRSTTLGEMIRLEIGEAESCGPEVVAHFLNEMRALAEPDAAFAVALIPTKETLRDAATERMDPLLEFCASEAIPCVSLLDSFLGREDRGRLYFAGDIHWTASGHQAVAEILSPFLADVLGGGSAEPGSGSP